VLILRRLDLRPPHGGDSERLHSSLIREVIFTRLLSTAR
jgi:hypothetical protein